jgi:hypothetical protein
MPADLRVAHCGGERTSRSTKARPILDQERLVSAAIHFAPAVHIVDGNTQEFLH